MLKSDSYRTGTSDTPLCDCGNDEETIEHYLLDCSMCADARYEMMDYIKDTGVVSESKGCLTVSETVLLAPPCDNSISRKDNNIIKKKELFSST